MKNLLGLLRSSLFCDKATEGPDLTDTDAELSRELQRVRQDMGDFDYGQILQKMEPEARQYGLERLAKIQFNNFGQLMEQYAVDLEVASQELDKLKEQLIEAEKKAVLQKSLLQQYEDISTIMNRTNKRNQHLEFNLNNLERRIGSWQYLIDEMKIVPDGVVREDII